MADPDARAAGGRRDDAVPRRGAGHGARRVRGHRVPRRRVPRGHARVPVARRGQPRSRGVRRARRRSTSRASPRPRTSRSVPGSTTASARTSPAASCRRRWRSIATRFPDLALAGPVDWKPETFGIWGPARLPVRWTPPPRDAAHARSSRSGGTPTGSARPPCRPSSSPTSSRSSGSGSSTVLRRPGSRSSPRGRRGRDVAKAVVEHAPGPRGRRRGQRPRDRRSRSPGAGVGDRRPHRGAAQPGAARHARRPARGRRRRTALPCDRARRRSPTGVERVLAGERYHRSRAVAGDVPDEDFEPTTLTAREREVLGLLASGCSNREIASRSSSRSRR